MVLVVITVLSWNINSIYANNTAKLRGYLLNTVFAPLPAIVPAGRNIAFEIGNAISNAPASYLTMLDCCESDEAIADRIAVGQTVCRIIKMENRQN